MYMSLNYKWSKVQVQLNPVKGTYVVTTPNLQLIVSQVSKVNY